MTPSRTSQLERKTAETQIALRLNLDGTGKNSIRTGVGFLDHMLVLFARHALVDLEVHANGDLEVDAHHTTEDVGICLGQAVRECLGDKAGILIQAQPSTSVGDPTWYSKPPCLRRRSETSIAS